MKEKALLIFILLLFAKVSLGQYTFNKAASFNGTTSYISTPSFSKLNLTTAIKIEAWIKPTTVTTNMGIVGKNYQTGYYFGLSSQNLVFYKGGAAVYEFTTHIIPNIWTHVAVEYTSGSTKFFINGSLASEWTGMTGAIPINSDSLRIGTDYESGHTLYFFNGQIDDVRIWNRTSSDNNWDNLNQTIPLAVSSPSGLYSGLAASYRMNGELTSLVPDEVLPVADAIPHDITYVNYSNKFTPCNDYNNSVYLNGTDAYLSSPNTDVYNSTNAITLEAWIKKDTTGVQNTSPRIVNKSGPGRVDYALSTHNNFLEFYLNNNSVTLTYENPALGNARWHHVAATYNSSTGIAKLYFDGNFVVQGTGSPITINNNPDSVFVGNIIAGSNSLFKGQIDEVRIWKNTERTAQQIKDNMFKNIDYNSSPAPSVTAAAIFGFDGKSYSSLLSLQAAIPSAGMNFRGSAQFTTSNNYSYITPGASPMLRDDANDFMGASYISSSKKLFIPDNNPAGIKDSVYVSAGGLFTGLRVFTLINHPYLSDLSYSAPGSGITLISPTGTSVVLTPSQISGEGVDLMTIFDMNADSTIKFNFLGGGLTAPFSPSVRPANPFSIFNGQPVTGWWKMRFVDRAATGTGHVNGWGIQLQIITGTESQNQLADKYELSQNYPNPFNPTTKINYSLKSNSFVKLSVFDETGKRITELVNQNQKSGSYSVDFKADEFNLSSGIYFYKLEADGFNETKKMILIK